MGKYYIEKRPKTPPSACKNNMERIEFAPKQETEMLKRKM